MALDLARPGRTALVLVLMLLVGFTEGLGLLMIVPILQSLVPGAGTRGALGWLFGAAGPPALGVLLAVFVLLVALRTRALAAMDATARWLDRNVGRAEDKLDALAGWCAIVGAGLLLPDGKPRRRAGAACRRAAATRRRRSRTTRRAPRACRRRGRRLSLIHI